MSKPPKKYCKINGIMKLNPEYKAWKQAQNSAAGAPTAATTVINSAQALPVVSSMEDHIQMNQDLGQDVALSESTNATLEMLQEPEIAVDAGMAPDDMIDELGALLSRYEIPIGLTNKLMLLSEYDSLEFIVDDSGSMQLDTDTIDRVTKRPLSRWVEAQRRLKEMIEIVSYVPFQQIAIEFLNRRDRITITRNGRSPKDLMAFSNQAIDNVFRRGPTGTTPALEKLQQSYAAHQGKQIARYFFGDGMPNGGPRAAQAITHLLKTRMDPTSNPVTFLSCTDDDDAVEWMKDAEEIAPYCSECDDFKDEANEVYKDQGAALPYTKGFHLICQLVSAMCPDDLDAMDESIPFTKFTLDNLLGVVHNDESYQHYFHCYVQAQRQRVVAPNDRTGQIKKNVRWNYGAFRNATGPAKTIPQVQEFRRCLAAAAANS